MNLEQRIRVAVAKRTAKLLRELEQAEKENLKTAKQIAVDLSSGPYSQAELTAMGHPYAARHPAPGLPPEIVNVQSGSFQADWETVEGTWTKSNSQLTNTLQNRNPVVRWLQGTKYMVPRPIAQEIIQRLRPLRRRRLQQAIRKGTRR